MFKILGLKYKIKGSELKVSEQNIITQNGRNQFKCEFEFSDEWNGFTKFCVFEIAGQQPISVEIIDNKCMVSSTATKFSNFKTGVFGINENATFTTNTSMIFTGSSISIDGEVDENITKNLYEQFILDAIAIRDEVKDYANSASKSVEQYPKVINGLLYFWDNESQEFVQTNFQDGLSAYELAINQGFDGSLDTWIESFKGDKGDIGEQGTQGEKGEAFVYEDFTEEQLKSLKGETGEQGIQGEKGDTGDTYELTDDDRQEIAEISQAEVTSARTSFEGEIQDSLHERINSDIAMLLDRFNQASLIPYDGESIVAENSYMGMTSGIEIQGNTYADENGEIECVSGNIELRSTAKNLLNLNRDWNVRNCSNLITTDETISFNYDGDWPRAYSTIDFFEIGKTYICSSVYENTNVDAPNTIHIDVRYKDGSTASLGSSSKPLTVTADMDTFTLYLMPNNSATSRSGNVIFSDIQIEESDTITDYQEYKEDTIIYNDVELRRIGTIYDSISNNKLTQKIGTRNYTEGDLEIEDLLVSNDLTTTYYILDEPVVNQLDTKEIKTYDGTTHITSTVSNVKPILSARIASDVGAVIASVSAENQQLMTTNQTLTNELSEANEILDNILYVD